MADHGSRRCAGPFAAVDGHEAGDVQPGIRHRDLALAPAPQRAGAVGGELDPVALGVVQVDRLAHQVVRGAVQGQSDGCGVPQPAAEIGTGRKQERGVEQTGGSRVVGAGPGRRDQGEQRLAAAAEHRSARILRKDGETDHVTVEGGQFREVTHRKGYVGDIGRGFAGGCRWMGHGPKPTASGAGNQYICWPPLIDSVDPVMKSPSSAVRNATPRAMSLAWPSRPIGMRATILVSTSAGTARTISVST